MQSQLPHPNLITFKVDGGETSKHIPSLVTAEKIISTNLHITNKFEDFSHRDHNQEAFVEEDLSDISGFLAAVRTAYHSHYSLKLSVNDFIVLIGQGLGKHINENAEKLRKYFVNHEGKEKIEIRRDEFILGEKNDWMI